MNHRQQIANDKRYTKWWENRTGAELQLERQAYEFQEKYFADLRLIAPSVARHLMRYEILDSDGVWKATEEDSDITISGWIITYRRFPSLLGQCSVRHRAIFISPKLDDIELRATLLHEMIHAYESMLSGPFREWLVLDLYRRMGKRIKLAKLNRYINASTHALVHEHAHGVLFLLKSLDLDLRFDWKLGTVFGYGREDYFSDR